MLLEMPTSAGMPGGRGLDVDQELPADVLRRDDAGCGGLVHLGDGLAGQLAGFMWSKPALRSA